MKAKLARGNVDELMRRTGLIYDMCNEVMNIINGMPDDNGYAGEECKGTMCDMDTVREIYSLMIKIREENGENRTMAIFMDMQIRGEL
jgi:hypothetical protein